MAGGRAATRAQIRKGKNPARTEKEKTPSGGSKGKPSSKNSGGSRGNPGSKARSPSGGEGGNDHMGGGSSGQSGPATVVEIEDTANSQPGPPYTHVVPVLVGPSQVVPLKTKRPRHLPTRFRGNPTPFRTHRPPKRPSPKPMTSARPPWPNPMIQAKKPKPRKRPPATTRAKSPHVFSPTQGRKGRPIKKPGRFTS